MSSAYSRWPLLYFFLPLPILAGQPSTVSLLTATARSVPTCAQPCFQSFIENEFPAFICPFPQTLDCLCISNSQFGFTLGEGSLRCVVTSCSEPEEIEKKEAYWICSNIPDAKPMTHGTLTATKFLNPTVSSSTRTSSHGKRSSSSRHSSYSRTNSARTNTHSSHTNTHSSHTNTHSSHTNTHSSPSRTRSSTAPRRTSNTTSTTVPTTRSTTSRSSTSSSFLNSPSTTTPSSTITSSSPTSSSSASATSPPPAPVAEPAPALSKSKIAGVAVGASFAALAFVGIIIFFVYRNRRRRSNRRDSGSIFGEDRIFHHPSSPSPSPALYHPIRPEVEPNDRSRDSTQLESQDGRVTPVGTNRSPASLWRGNEQPETGVAVAPDMTPRRGMAESPGSLQSWRTPSRPSSRLLPDKPVYSLYPAPLRINHSVSPESPGGGVVPGAAGIGQRGALPLSKAAPRGRNSSDTSQVSLQRDWSKRHPSASNPFLDSLSEPSLATYARQRSQNPQSEGRDYDRPNPEMLNGQWSQSLENLPKPVPARQSSSARTLTQQQAVKASISPSDYRGRLPFDFPSQPIAIARKPVPRRRSTPRRSATHYSSASDTSFESAGDEDPTPTVNFILSPVAESPAIRSDRRQVTSPNISGSPESPTRKPTRRKQPPTSAAASKPLKSSLKPLLKVPENPDSSTPLLTPRRGDRVPAPIVTDARGSPRRETELTAKHKILVIPGLQPLENSGTPRSGRSSAWAPNTPTRRDAL